MQLDPRQNVYFVDMFKCCQPDVAILTLYPGVEPCLPVLEAMVRLLGHF